MENNTQGKSTLAAVGSELKPIISNKSDCLLKQNTDQKISEIGKKDSD